MQNYEVNVDKYNGTLEDAGAKVTKRPVSMTLADSVERQVTFELNKLINICHFMSFFDALLAYCAACSQEFTFFV